jgi:hypothetical protein
MTRASLATALVAATALVTAAAPSGAATRDGRDATRLLTGTQWATYNSGNVTGASQDRVLHLCRGGRFVLLTSFVSTYVEGADDSSYDHPYGESRVTGSWRVARARLGANRRAGTALVRYVTDEGDRGTVVFTAGSRGATIAGAPADVRRSTLCG